MSFPDSAKNLDNIGHVNDQSSVLQPSPTTQKGNALGRSFSTTNPNQLSETDTKISETVKQNLDKVDHPQGFSLQELRERRSASPISKDAIEQEARLFAAARKGLNYAAEQEKLKGMGTSANIVMKMTDIKEHVVKVTPKDFTPQEAFEIVKTKNNQMIFIQDKSWLVATCNHNGALSQIPFREISPGLYMDPYNQVITREQIKANLGQLPEVDVKALPDDLIKLRTNNWMLHSEGNNMILSWNKGGTVEKLTLTFNPNKDCYIDNNKKEWTVDSIKTHMNSIGCKHINFGPVAFYKRGQDGEMATGIMEKLMWDMANVMGVPKQFAATKEIDIRTKTELTGGNETATILTPEGELKKVSGAQEALKGGIQAAGGMVLSEMLSNPAQHPTRPSVIQGTLTTMVFGMWDAHPGNILADKEGNVTFFDNTRSMPHTNSFINRIDGSFSSYRSGLLCLQDSYIPLNPHEINQLKEQLKNFEGKLENLKKFMNNPQTQAQIDGLPPGWLNTEETLKATEERIRNIKTALGEKEDLSDCKIVNLRDLTMAFNPQFKLNAALEIISRLPRLYNNLEMCASLPPQAILQIQTINLAHVGSQSMEALLDNCANRGINPEDIKKLCEDPTISFDQVVYIIAKLMSEKATEGISQSAKDSAQEAANKLKINIQAEAKVDLKDIPRRAIRDGSIKIIQPELEKAGIKQQPSFEIEESKLNPNEMGYVLDGSKPPMMMIHYRRSDNKMEEYVADYSSIPGKIILKIQNVELPAMSIAEMKDWLDSSKPKTIGHDIKTAAEQCKEAGVRIETMPKWEVQEEANNLKPGEFLIAQKHASVPPQFTMFRKNANEKVDSYTMHCVEGGKFVIKIKGKNVGPIAIEDLKNRMDDLIKNNLPGQLKS